jgi:nucleoside-diphosphate-sugar epimerase
MNTVLITGGAGYIGSVVVRKFLEANFNVKVFDKLNFGGEPLVEFLNNPKFTFVKGDIRNEIDLEKVIKGSDIVIHLAAIVGDPACAKDKSLSFSTNLEGTKLIYQLSEKYKVKRFIFASTCSNYGKMDDPSGYVNENSPLNPVSLYAETKVQAENFLLNQNKNNYCKPTVLRLSTVYGISPRPRFDLTVNEFAKELALGRELVIFGEQFWRPYCHVIDLANAFLKVSLADVQSVAFDVFNVGDNKENFQKKMIIEEISKQIKNIKVNYVQKNEDPRDYRVNFDKIHKRIDFKITKTVPDGIRDIIFAVQNGFFINPDDSKYKNC